MKKLRLLLMLAGLSVTGISLAQTTPATPTVFATQAEKDAKIAQLEAKIKTDTNDQTFPAAELAKEKKQLTVLKKAVVRPASN